MAGKRNKHGVRSRPWLQGVGGGSFLTYILLSPQGIQSKDAAWIIALVTPALALTWGTDWHDITDQVRRRRQAGKSFRAKAVERLAEESGMTNDDECAVKHCDEVATLGMTWRFGNVRIEFYVCERHFDEIGAVDEVGPPEKAS